MEILQDQSLITLVVVLLGLAGAWWVFRGALRWLRRLSRLGCLAVIGGMILLAVAGSLR